MKRHFYISEDLDELEAVENELEQQGISTPQIHVLSEDDAGVEQHHLHEVQAVLKKDVVHSTEMGALIGLLAAAMILSTAYFLDVMETVGVMPFVFLAVVVIGFCAWEGGLMGIQEPHQQFKRFQQALKEGKHIFFVDTEQGQELALARVVQAHPQLQLAGVGKASPSWLVGAQNNWRKFLEVMP
jgi:hypothetical protein